MARAGARITWLGHSTFLVAGADGTTVLVDPFVMNNPSCPEGAHPFDRLDVVAVTHGHMDHVADAAAVLEQAPDARIVAIVELAVWLRAQGIDASRVVEMNKGGTVRFPGVAITMVDANHSTGLPSADGSIIYCGEPAGLVLEFADGTRVYHAGDTNVFGDMALIGELYRPDIVLLPIGDHYTMGPFEAAKACELLDCRRVIPMHFGTFPVLTGTPIAFEAECRRRGLDVEVIDMQPGETIE